MKPHFPKRDRRHSLPQSRFYATTHYLVNHKQGQNTRHNNEQGSSRKPQTPQLHTEEPPQTNLDMTCHPLHSSLFVVLSNVARVDIHHLDDILMSHPQAVSISPHLTFSLPPTHRPSLHK